MSSKARQVGTLTWEILVNGKVEYVYGRGSGELVRLVPPNGMALVGMFPNVAAALGEVRARLDEEEMAW